MEKHIYSGIIPSEFMLFFNQLYINHTKIPPNSG